MQKKFQQIRRRRGEVLEVDEGRRKGEWKKSSDLKSPGGVHPDDKLLVLIQARRPFHLCLALFVS